MSDEINLDVLEIFFHYLKEREKIRKLKLEGVRPPNLTADPILATYKFTNVSRHYDRTTQWVYKNWYFPHRGEHSGISLGVQAFNCALFRYFGTMEFAEVIGYQKDFNPQYLIDKASERRLSGKKVFTGAYIITNGGISAPKEEVVVKNYLAPFWENRQKIVDIALESQSWERTLDFIGRLNGFGPFMRKEVGLDMMYTDVLKECDDRHSWSPAGPGAIRGLNRLLDREVEDSMTQKEALDHMRYLLPIVRKEMESVPHMHDVMLDFGVTDVQFCLCELDKYCRVLKNEGRPRSRYTFKG